VLGQCIDANAAQALMAIAKACGSELFKQVPASSKLPRGLGAVGVQL